MTGTASKRWRRLAIPSLTILAAILACAEEGGEPEAPAPEPPAPMVSGALRVSLVGTGGPAREPLLHETVLVPGPRYRGVDDNDIRGFLDGRFLYGWNQPLQVHVRLGRRGSSPRYGETELYRVLQRWELRLPREVRVERAALRVGVEAGSRRPLTVLLYEVHGDWSPGRGGERRNNNDPPEPGDVWWGARAHERKAWGLPGAGFASDVHPDADTPRAALAATVLAPGDAELVFAGPALARYLERCAREAKPARFLLKLSDALEDEVGTAIALYSAEHGDFRNPARRPRLEITWRAAGKERGRERPLVLEPGRAAETGRIETGGAEWLAASFAAQAGSGPWTLLVRGGARGGAGGAFTEWAGAYDVRGLDWVEVRLVAAANPVALGGRFETSLRDTWVRTRRPEEQDVRFVFVAPDGARHEVLAEYRGDYRWAIAFAADQLGTWRYHFEHELELPYRSAEGRFDVVGADREAVVAALRTLLAEAQAGPVEKDPKNVPLLAPRFWRLERALLALETPESSSSPEGRTRFALLTTLRETLGQRPAPDTPPQKPMPRDW